MESLGKWMTWGLLLAISGGPSEARKVAFLVGVDDYSLARQDRDLLEQGAVYPDLPSADQDVQWMQALLKYLWGFDEVYVLTGRKATARAIDTQFRQYLVDSLQAEDIALFYYTGHGSFYPDQSGDEPDGWDECIVTADGRALLDDLLGRWVDEIPAHQATIIFDTCHAGSGLRAPREEEDPLEVDWPLPTKAVPSPVKSYPGPGTQRTETPVPYDPWRQVTDGRTKGHPPYVFLAACGPGEEASGETPPGYPPPLSLFTPYLCTALQEATPTTTWRKVKEEVARRVYRVNPLQHPVGEGPLDRTVFESLAPERVFGPAEYETSQSFPSPTQKVFAGKGKEVWLWPGFIAPEQNGGLGEVYRSPLAQPHGTLRFTGDIRFQGNRPLARAELLTGQLVTGDQVRPVRQPFPDPALRVQVAPFHSLFGGLTRLRDQLPFARATQDDQDWDVWLSGCLQGGTYFRKTMLRQACRWLESNTRSGIRYEGSEKDLLGNWKTQLSAFQAQRTALSLHNLAPPFLAELWIEDPVRRFPGPQDGESRSFRWRVGSDAYVAILLIRPDGTYQILHLDPKDRSQPAQGGQTYTVSIPFPDAPDQPLSALVQLLATTVPLDLQEVRDCNPSDLGSGFRQALHKAAGIAGDPDFLDCDRWVEASMILELP